MGSYLGRSREGKLSVQSAVSHQAGLELRVVTGPGDIVILGNLNEVPRHQLWIRNLDSELVHQLLATHAHTQHHKSRVEERGNVQQKEIPQEITKKSKNLHAH